MPLHQSRDHRGARAFLQKLQGAVRMQSAIEKITFPLGIGAPFIELIALGNENPALFESLHGSQDDVTLIGVDEVEAHRLGPLPPRASGPTQLESQSSDLRLRQGVRKS